MSTKEVIYEAILKKCDPYISKFGGPIDGVVSDFFKTPANPASLRKELSATFTQEQLQNAGLFRKDELGRQVWAFPFEDGGSQVVFALRKESGQASFEIVTDRGCLSFQTYPVLAVLDHFAMQPSENQHRLFVTATLADAAFFWQIGLPAICGVGLNHLQQPWIDQFCEKLEFGKGKGVTSHWNGIAPHLVLVNWSPARLDWEVPKYMEVIASHLHDLMEHLSIGLQSICLWAPTVEKRQTFKVSMKYAGAAEVHEHVIDSVDWCKDHLGDRPRRAPLQEPRTFSEAHEAWRKSLRRINDQNQQEKSWSGRTEKLASDVLAPLRQQAEGSSDALERSLTLTLAELSGLLDPQMAMLSAKVEKLYVQGTAQTQGSFPQQEIETTLKLVDRVLATTKEIQACRSNKKFAPKSQTPSGSDSDSQTKNSPR